MSLVEKALRKMQAGPRTEQKDVGDAQVIGTVVSRVEVQPPADFSPSTAMRVVHIDRDKLRSALLLPPESQERELADQYRAIKRPLIRYAFGPADEPGPARQLVMMASALPGDGKTFTSINLALSLSLERDHNVLLVDADVPKPHVSRVFGVDKEPGLLDVLTDPNRSIESVILPTDVPRLSILPVGGKSDTATEWLASARMKEVAARLAALYPRGIVLFDSPPVLLTSESRILATLAGQVVLVVKAGETPQQAVKDTVELLHEHKRVALVLNQAQLTGVAGYYYGYRYGYGSNVASAE